MASMEIIHLELKTLQSGHDFQSQGQMTLKIEVKVKGHYMQHSLSYWWSFVLNMERIHREL